MANTGLNDCYEKEVAEREAILNKVRQNIKISKDERSWLMTHSLYNRRHGKNFFNIAIEKVHLRKWLSVVITIESVSYNGRILPIISVPDGKGKIIADFEIRDYNGHAVNKKTIKCLGFLPNSPSHEHKVEYFSDLGLISIHYECDYFDDKQNLNKREASSTGNPEFAMIRQVIDNQRVRFFCKSPTSDSFDALVFTLEWKQTAPGSLIDPS